MPRFWKRVGLLVSAVTVFSLVFISVAFAYTFWGYKWITNQTGLDYDHLSSNWRNVCYYSRTTWNNTGSKMKIYYDPSSQNDVAVGYFSTTWCGLAQARGYWFGRWYFSEVDISINTKDCGPTYGSLLPAYNRIDGQSTTTHELGHLVGLGHSYYPTTMDTYAYWGAIWQRSLHSDDIAGIRALYP